jgi:hypothetical protein
MNEPPKKEAAPAKEAAGSGEQTKSSTTAADVQAPESALSTLCKSWMRASATDRALFLSDVRAGCPNLWRAIDRDAQGGSR